MRKWVWAILAVAFFGGLWVLPLLEPDEGRYTNISAAMVTTGDWLTPRLDGIRYYEKPPFAFWTVAASIRVFGFNEFAARLPSALASFLTALLLLHWGRRAFDERTGALAALILATIPLFMVLARIVLVDQVLTLWIALAFYSAYRGIFDSSPDPTAAENSVPCPQSSVLGPRSSVFVSPSSPPKGAAGGPDGGRWTEDGGLRSTQNRQKHAWSGTQKWILAFWASAALATLTKGPIGLGLPLVSVGTYLLLTKQWRRIGSFARPDGPLLYLVLVSPWYIAMSLKNSEFAYQFFVEQNWHRFTHGGRFGRNQPFWYYLPILVGAFLPWSLFLPIVVRDLWREKLKPSLPLFLACAFLVPLIVLSMAHSMLAYYLLPICAPFALLTAHRILASEEWVRRWSLRLLGGFGAILLVVAIVAIVPARMDTETLRSRYSDETGDSAASQRRRIAEIQRVLPALTGLGILVGGAAVAAGALVRRGRALLGFGTLAGAIAGVGAGIPFAGRTAAALYSAEPSAELIARCADRDAPVLVYQEYLRGLSFYLGRPVMLWEAAHNEFGQAVTPEEAEGKSLLGKDDRLKRWLDGPRRVYIFVEGPAKEKDIREKSPVPIEVLGTSGRFTLLATVPRRPE